MIKLIISTIDNFFHDHVTLGSSAVPIATSMLTIIPVHIADFLALAGGMSALFGMVSNGMKSYHEWLLIKQEKQDHQDRRLENEYLKNKKDNLEN